MSNIEILIIEDEAVIAQDIASKLRTLGYDIAGIISRSDIAIDFLSTNTPDLVTFDIYITGDKDGIGVAESILPTKKIPFVFLTSFSDRDTIARAKKVLPYGYIVKPFNKADLFSAIEMALYKHSVELEKLAISKHKIDLISEKPLSEREYELLVDITQGLSNKQITEKRKISLNTVKFHIRNILTKLNVPNRACALHKIIELLSK